MITEKGKQIIGKYLIGQTSSFGNYIAIGCGASPASAVNTRKFSVSAIDLRETPAGTYTLGLQSTQNHNILVGESIIVTGLAGASGYFVATSSYSFKVIGVTLNKVFVSFTADAGLSTYVAINGSTYFYADLSVNKNLIFEMERFPVIAKTFYKDSQTNKMKLVFKAEIPPEQRYRISEIGLFPAKNDVLNTVGDSKKIAVFLSGEGWRRVTPGVSDALIGVQDGSVDDATTGQISIQDGIAFVTDSNASWQRSNRITRNEVPRFLNESLIFNRTYSTFDGTNFPDTSPFIENPSIYLNLSQNSPDDVVKIAASFIPKDYTKSSLPSKIAFKIEFINQSATGERKSAMTTVTYDGPLASSDFAAGFSGFDFVKNYFVASTPLNNFVTDPGFSWATINSIRLWAWADQDYSDSDDYLILLDGLRIDGTNQINPLYGLVAHNVVITSDATPILKRENTSSYIEFKMDLGD